MGLWFDGCDRTSLFHLPSAHSRWKIIINICFVKHFPGHNILNNKFNSIWILVSCLAERLFIISFRLLWRSISPFLISAELERTWWCKVLRKTHDDKVLPFILSLTKCISSGFTYIGHVFLCVFTFNIWFMLDCLIQTLYLSSSHSHSTNLWPPVSALDCSHKYLRCRVFDTTYCKTNTIDENLSFVPPLLYVWTLSILLQSQN